MSHGQCDVPGCSRPATTIPGGHFGTLCLHHKQHRRCHGDPRQEPISARHLRPYFKEIAKARRLNSESPVWKIVEGHWQDAIEEAREYEARWDAGGPVQTHRLKAYREILSVAEHADPQTVVDTITAMSFMWASQPNLFRSHDGFRAQVARRFRRLAPVNVATRYEQATGRVRKVYREVGHRVLITLGQILIDHVGALGAHLANVEKKRLERKAEDRKVFVESVQALV